MEECRSIIICGEKIKSDSSFVRMTRLWEKIGEVFRGLF